MKIIELERCGRVCHQSQPKGDAAQFVRMLIICDRAIMAELTRHRLASFSVESTRYVKYNNLSVVNPPDTDIFTAELAYQKLIEHGVKPEEARAVLPLCTKNR